jgi:hypothetical protein
VLQRLSLEFAAYGLHIDKVPRAAKKWLDRHKYAASWKAANIEFDFGGHPNEPTTMEN